MFYLVEMSFYRSPEHYLPPLAGTFGKNLFIVRARDEDAAQDAFLLPYRNAGHEPEGDLSLRQVTEAEALRLVSEGKAPVVLGSRMYRHWPWGSTKDLPAVPRRSRRNPRSTGYVAAKIRANTARKNSHPYGKLSEDALFEIIIGERDGDARMAKTVLKGRGWKGKEIDKSIQRDADRDYYGSDSWYYAVGRHL